MVVLVHRRLVRPTACGRFRQSGALASAPNSLASEAAFIAAYSVANLVAAAWAFLAAIVAWVTLRDPHTPEAH